MKIKKLIKNIPEIILKGFKEAEISGVSVNSKLISPGNLFIAKKGAHGDGSDYIGEAIEAGATAIATDVYDPSLPNIAQLIHPSVSSIEAALAANYYRHPSQELYTVGITGTNGKTTTSFLVKHLFDSFQMPCGLIGTIEYIMGHVRYQATLTTPDACTNQKMLREMVLQECQAAVMEVSSHALEQKRTGYIQYDAAIFTNLTHEHLDYHLTMENYAESKRKLFLSLNQECKKKEHPFPKLAIVNSDSEWHKTMLEGCKVGHLLYGIDSDADLRASSLNCTSNGSYFKLSYRGNCVDCYTPLVGRFNIYNFMAATAAGLARNYSLNDIVECLSKAPYVPGRLEGVPNNLGIKIYVDFAHSHDSLKNVLEALNEVKESRIITVFGCGGDRDKMKRPKMAEICEIYSDLCIVTNDNPRTENPQTICSHILEGFSDQNKYIVELDRREAIAKAIQMAKPKDIILIAGKGHEPYQIFAHSTVEFDDRKTAAELCCYKHPLC